MDQWSLYTAPEDAIDADLLRAFIAEQRESRLLMESLTLELKRRRQGDNIARAIAAFANTDGGILLVGVDEDNPSFDTAPGVSPTEVVAISDSCRNLLDPLVQPSIVPVPLPEGDRVVVVIRVDPDPATVPVCKAGAVFVRAPGQTVPATREQIIALANRPQAAGASLPRIPSLNTAFYPDFQHSQDSTGDALIRVAGGVWLRPSVGEFMFGTAQRDSLRTAIEGTPFARYPALNDSGLDRPELRPRCRVEAFTAATATFVIDYPDDEALYRVSVRMRRDGHRIAFALDLELRLRLANDVGDDRTEAKARVGRDELATALITGVETAAILLPSHIATLARSAPRRLDDICVWVNNPRLSLDSLLDLRGLSRVSPNSMGSQWGWEARAPRNAGEVTTAVQTELERLYLNLGLHDAERIADEDVRRALDERARIFALV